MTTYAVQVRNRQTGERRDVTVEASCEVDAKVEALYRLFREEGWHNLETVKTQVVTTQRSVQ